MKKFPKAKMSKISPYVALKQFIIYNLCFKCETLRCVIMSDKQQFSELTTLGMKFYEEKLKPILEPEHNGEFVAIEPYLEKYVLEKKKIDAILKAQEEMPERLFFLARVGTIYTGKLRNYVPRKRLD